jgi:5-methylcytosine-specific restriction endonuclease McrA
MARNFAAKYLNPWMFKREKKRAQVKALRERDGDICWRCHHPMRFGEPYNVGRAATIEHKLPRGAKGRNRLENLVLCHVGCNRFLGSNTPEQKERMRLRRET